MSTGHPSLVNHGYDKETKTCRAARQGTTRRRRRYDNGADARRPKSPLKSTKVVQSDADFFFIRTRAAFFVIEKESFRESIEFLGINNRDLLL